jgi:hypothetical protein
VCKNNKQPVAHWRKQSSTGKIAWSRLPCCRKLAPNQNPVTRQ